MKNKMLGEVAIEDGQTKTKQRRERIKTESRTQMLERLSNPEISLHEAVVLLEVCAATVRRLSDSGILAHERTVGGQRRFRLRDVLQLAQEREAQRVPMPRSRLRRKSRSLQRPLSSARPAGMVRPPSRDARELLASTRARAQAALAQAQATRARQLQAQQAQQNAHNYQTMRATPHAPESVAKTPPNPATRALLARLANAQRSENDENS